MLSSDCDHRRLFTKCSLFKYNRLNYQDSTSVFYHVKNLVFVRCFRNFCLTCNNYCQLMNCSRVFTIVISISLLAFCGNILYATTLHSWDTYLYIIFYMCKRCTAVFMEKRQCYWLCVSRIKNSISRLNIVGHKTLSTLI